MKCKVNNDVVLARPLEGPLSTYIPGFAQWARQEGYTFSTRQRKVHLAACFSRWLAQRAASVRQVNPEHAARYQRSHASHVQIRRGDAATLRQLLDFLRRQGVAPEEKVSPFRLTPIEQIVQAFEGYLRNERSLSEETVTRYVPFVRKFLADRFGEGSVSLSRLCAGDVVRFVRRQAPRLHLKTAKLLTSALRSFLHYVRYRGEITQDLAAAVPTVANWSMPSIPRAIPKDAVRQLLASINRRTATGRRDYAILLLLARLGLRAVEVVRLQLQDIDWNGGSLTVPGKGSQRSILPLPADVGSAIATYLRHGRPKSSCRQVFLRTKAPIRGFHGSFSIASLVRNNLARAGIQAPTKGAHQFRHALATEMLHHGASLAEIGEVLRHRNPETTKIYTKVDLDSLRTLALPWPGGAR
ncbi:MAG TPA: site-specific integrase [Candidatus Dormibacteraeota bacterium]|nr:site-specific integrase [Candidatus Dormibacteraeota bacterium]